MLGGLFVFMWAASLRFKLISRGYLRSTSWVLWPLMFAAAYVLPAGLRSLGTVTAALYLLYLLAVYSQRPLLEWATGAMGAASSLALTGWAGRSACPAGCILGLVHALVGAAVLGAVAHGMVLGHWYLNQARLPIEPLKEQTALIFVVMGISALVGALTRPWLVQGTVPSGMLAYSSSSYWWIWLLLLAFTALLMSMVRVTVRDRSTQSATGLLYLATLTALAAQFVLSLLVTT